MQKFSRVEVKSKLAIRRSFCMMKGERWFNPTALLWGGTIPPHLRPSKDGVLPNEVGKDEEGTLP